MRQFWLSVWGKTSKTCMFLMPYTSLSTFRFVCARLPCIFVSVLKCLIWFVETEINLLELWNQTNFYLSINVIVVANNEWKNKWERSVGWSTGCCKWCVCVCTERWTCDSVTLRSLNKTRARKKPYEVDLPKSHIRKEMKCKYWRG